MQWPLQCFNYQATVPHLISHHSGTIRHAHTGLVVGNEAHAGLCHRTVLEPRFVAYATTGRCVVMVTETREVADTAEVPIIPAMDVAITCLFVGRAGVDGRETF